RFSRNWSSDVCSSDLEVRLKASKGVPRCKDSDGRVRTKSSTPGELVGRKVAFCICSRGLCLRSICGAGFVSSLGRKSGARGPGRSEERRVGKEWGAGR